MCGCGGPALSSSLACPVGAACCGGGGGPSPGGRPATVVRGVWCQALSLPRPPVLWGWKPGFRDLCCPVAVGAGVGIQHQPHSVRPRGPVLRAVRVAEGRPRGGVPFAVVRGAWGQALPLPRLPALLTGFRGPLPTCCGCGCAGVGALHWPRGSRTLWWTARHGGCGGRLGSGAPPSLLPARWAGCRGPLATCSGREYGCVRCVWCLCGVCGGAWRCLSPVPLVPPSPVPCCGVVLALCLPCCLPCARPLLGCWLSPVFIVASSLFTLSSTFSPLALLPGMHFFPASALVCVSVCFLACFLGPGSRALFSFSCWVL